MKRLPIIALFSVTLFVSCSQSERIDSPSPSHAGSGEVRDASETRGDLEKIPDALLKIPTYRACIARSVSSCGSDLIASDSGTLDCGVFRGSELEKECRDMAEMGKAFRNLDSSKCSTLNDWKKSNCEFGVAVRLAVKNEDPKACVDLRSSAASKNAEPWNVTAAASDSRANSCLMEAASALSGKWKTRAFCDKIENGAISEECERSVIPVVPGMANAASAVVRETPTGNTGTGK